MYVLSCPQASCTLSEHFFAYHQLIFQSHSALSPLGESCSSNVWRVTCRCYILAHRPSPLSFLHCPAHSGMPGHSSKKPCPHFRSRGGCRSGKKCNFSHNLGSTSGTRTSPQSSRKNASPSPTLATPVIRSVNVCNIYWNAGQCNRGFDCTFIHQKNPVLRPDRSNVADGTEDEEDAANAALDFFTMVNLTQMAGVELHSTQKGTPEEAHNSIKRYLGGGSLNNPAEMKPLITILASINRRNHSWVRIVPPFMPDRC